MLPFPKSYLMSLQNEKVRNGLEMASLGSTMEPNPLLINDFAFDFTK